MMAELSTIARPYAEALFSVAKGLDAAKVQAELTALASVAAHADVQDLVKNPNVSRAQVLDTVTAAVKDALSPTVANFLATVVQNGRTTLLPEIAVQFAGLKNASEGASDAHITSAFELSSAQLTDLTVSLQKKFGLTLKPTVSVDPRLIGGVRVNVGDQVLDTSVQAQLERMRVALLA
jgi:F-type H+-transporting ATPase subunit delta